MYINWIHPLRNFIDQSEVEALFCRDTTERFGEQCGCARAFPLMFVALDRFATSANAGYYLIRKSSYYFGLLVTRNICPDLFSNKLLFEPNPVVYGVRVCVHACRYVRVCVCVCARSCVHINCVQRARVCSRPRASVTQRNTTR